MYPSVFKDKTHRANKDADRLYPSSLTGVPIRLADVYNARTRKDTYHVSLNGVTDAELLNRQRLTNPSREGIAVAVKDPSGSNKPLIITQPRMPANFGPGPTGQVDAFTSKELDQGFDFEDGQVKVPLVDVAFCGSSTVAPVGVGFSSYKVNKFLTVSEIDAGTSTASDAFKNAVKDIQPNGSFAPSAQPDATTEEGKAMRHGTTLVTPKNIEGDAAATVGAK